MEKAFIEGLPRYQSHKIVRALKIKKVHVDEGGLGLSFEDPALAIMALTNDQIAKKPTPEDGWYLVVYDNEYFSFSPAKEFEEGYTDMDLNPPPSERSHG
jgi:hypothetical protein